jgi:hypothetical protein
VSRAIQLALLLCLACGRAPIEDAPGEAPRVPTTAFREPGYAASGGPERYSAWFADSDGHVLYFGLSPFWELWWARDGNPLADLDEAGAHLIGRFDLDRERFLPPLRVRERSAEVRSSVWDVLVHSNGRVYYTTFFEEAGSVARDGSDVRHFADLGAGLNELVEGPDGNVYVTRYSDRPSEPERQTHGSIVVLSPSGRRLREHRLWPEAGRFVAPKSLAVDPGTGEIWLNTDTFEPDGSVSHERLRLAADGRVLERSASPPELLFVSFDAGGRGWFAEAAQGSLQLRIREGGRFGSPIPLGARDPLDFVQDIRFDAEGAALLALWSGRVLRVRLDPDGAAGVQEFRLELPPDCTPARRRSLLYTAVRRGDRLYATLFCGPTVLRTGLQ